MNLSLLLLLPFLLTVPIENDCAWITIADERTEEILNSQSMNFYWMDTFQVPPVYNQCGYHVAHLKFEIWNDYYNQFQSTDIWGRYLDWNTQPAFTHYEIESYYQSGVVVCAYVCKSS